MKISLFRHNQTAYEAALKMLSATGKAAIVHPTGTGKSFIAFKLCEDFPKAVICWLSPSEYIYKTQVENLRATGADVPENIRFFTYAKLMGMEDSDLLDIQPDYIILDEFHRCGAEMWGDGVSRLLNAFPSVPVLGLSATSIRYLDDQRDMAEELFDGNLASQMTLGEAIVRGILNPPRYVLSVYSVQKDLDQYTKRIQASRSKAVRDAGERYLDALRRALENAEGLDEMFRRHMTDPQGKYLVFCSNAQHMGEMMEKVPQWFGKIDPHPHVYSAYSDDPAASKAFAAFKEDGSDHLKLLFCIDMLNEGIHVENISGVILLRPTISPIVFKQQIGRALSASKTKDAVIFDVVMNIKNLYSIGSIQEEMKAAITYYRYMGDPESIVHEQFQVIDELQECRQLFEELENTLSASWELMYVQAKNYFETHGNLLVPVKYKTESGYSLGSWLATQRRIYNGEIPGHLTRQQVQKLEEIGIVWGSYRLLAWEQNFQEAEKYYQQYADLRVPPNYVTQTGVSLGIWIQMMRQARSNQRTAIVTPERIERLDAIGMIWGVISDQWEKNYQEAAAYYQANGNLLVPARYISENGIKLGNWISHLRSARRGIGRGAITEEQIQRLNLIGMAWDAEEERWQIGLSAAKAYFRQNGHLRVPVDYTGEDGFELGRWIRLKRRQHKSGSLSSAQIRSLESIGMLWDVFAEQWMQMYEAAKQYYGEHGNLDVPSRYQTASGQNLGTWIAKCRRDRGTLSPERIAMLDKIGMNWEQSSRKPVSSNSRRKIYRPTTMLGSMDSGRRVESRSAPSE